MKLKDTYITHESDGEQILLDTSSSFGIYNGTFMVMLQLISQIQSPF